MQARNPARLGRFWEGALALVQGHSSADDYEGRMHLGEALFLDICIERVPNPPPASPRLHLDLRGGDGQAQVDVVERLLEYGATHHDVGQGTVPWTVLADPDGNPFCVMDEREAYANTGPIAALPLDSANPERDGALYAALTGWVPVAGVAPVTLRHPSLRGPLLELCPELEPKHGQNRLHLDVRPEAGGPGQAEMVDLALSLGATRAEEDWAQGHSWVVLRDASGNEFCVLQDS